MADNELFGNSEQLNDTISRREALKAMDTWDKFGCDPDGKLVRYDDDKHYIPYVHYEDMVHAIKALPSAQSEPLTDKEQRIFLAAMGREEKICEEVDRNYVWEPHEDSLMRVCKEIRRKVKGALWT